MSFNITDLIKGQLGTSIVSQAATQLGESESAVSKAIGALLPAVLGGLASNSDKPGVLDSITGAASSGILENLIGGSSNNSMISTVLNLIFGDKQFGLIQQVSSFAGISENSTSSLLNIVTGATLGSIGKHAADNNLGAADISNLLGDQKGFLASLLPAGLSLGSLGIFGNLFDGVKDAISGAANVVGDVANSVSDTAGNIVSGTADIVSDAADAVAGVAGSAVSSATEFASNTAEKVGDTLSNVGNALSGGDNNGGGSIWKWLIPVLLLGLLGFWLWNSQCKGKNENASNDYENSNSTNIASNDSSGIKKDSTNTLETKPTITELVLPSGKKINAFKGGVEDQLVKFLQSDEYKNGTEELLKTRWFNFDNLNFDFGKSTITKESMTQVENLKAIIAEFPDAKFKIGAYTDKKGDDATNLKLSQSRAESVKNAIGSVQIIEAKGYGEEFAKVPENASDKERESDRKTAIRLTK